MKKNTLIIFLSIFLTFYAHQEAHTKNTFFEDGKKLYDSNKYIDSKFYFEKNIVFNPKHVRSYLYLAKIFKIGKKDNLEENNLNTILLLDPKHEEAIYLLTLLNIKRSNFSKAKELISTMSLICEKMCFTKKELEEKLERSQKSK